MKLLCSVLLFAASSAAPSLTREGTTAFGTGGDTYFDATDKPLCEVGDDGRTYVHFNKQQDSHSSFLCNHNADGSCTCNFHPTHHHSGCKQFHHTDASLHTLTEFGDCTATTTTTTTTTTTAAPSWAAAHPKIKVWRAQKRPGACGNNDNGPGATAVVCMLGDPNRIETCYMNGVVGYCTPGSNCGGAFTDIEMQRQHNTNSLPKSDCTVDIPVETCSADTCRAPDVDTSGTAIEYKDMGDGICSNMNIDCSPFDAYGCSPPPSTGAYAKHPYYTSSAHNEATCKRECNAMQDYCKGYQWSSNPGITHKCRLFVPCSDYPCSPYAMSQNWCPSGRTTAPTSMYDGTYFTDPDGNQRTAPFVWTSQYGISVSVRGGHNCQQAHVGDGPINAVSDQNGGQGRCYAKCQTVNGMSNTDTGCTAYRSIYQAGFVV